MNDASDVLTLDNFWNEQKANFPLAVQEWCDWVDEYKKKVGWVHLMNGRVYTHLVAPKVHELPIALQVGLHIQFRFDKGLMPGIFEIHSNWKDNFIRVFAWREIVLKAQQQGL